VSVALRADALVVIGDLVANEDHRQVLDENWISIIEGNFGARHLSGNLLGAEGFAGWFYLFSRTGHKEADSGED
jgi:hypothetical protein